MPRWTPARSMSSSSGAFAECRMRASMLARIVCGIALCAGVAIAEPPPADVAEVYKRAAQLDDKGLYEQALAAVAEGLAIAPKELRLLQLKGTVLLKMRDYSGALTAYQAYLDAGATGANRREAQKIVRDLSAVRSTFVDIEVANGPAIIYLGSRSQGAFCTAAPSCAKPLLPGDYKVIAERPGFERWTGQITVESGTTTKLAIELVEKPSLLTVRVAQPGARVTVDGADYDAPASVPAGTHQVVVALAGHLTERREAVAH